MAGSQYFYGVKPILIRRAFRATPVLPEFVGEGGDILLVDFLMSLLRLQVSLVGVLKILSGAFVSGPVIFFSMVLGAATMGVGSKVTVLGGYLL
jgi:hypothetical protein